MQIIGLTGSIASGKSTAAHYLKSVLMIPVFDADEEVRKLYEFDETVKDAICELCPSAIRGGEISLIILKEMAFDSPDLLKKLEEIIHPLLKERLDEFLDDQDELCVLDIPLLFETGWNSFCSQIITLVCDESLQLERLKKRGLTDHQIEMILSRQMSMTEKANRSDYCLFSDGPEEEMLNDLQKIIEELND
ncbi:MAG: dephospho-CoA kinase [Alphaproteobacteria bacterium]|nr:dephospho-CoA kinase [Alphaproteobacteria bacterium]